MKYIIYILMICIAISSVLGYKIVSDYDNYFEVNTTNTVRAFFYNDLDELLNNTIACVQLTMNGTIYNFSFTNNYWYITVSDDVEEDTYANITGYDSESCTGDVKSLNYEVFKWRVPFTAKLCFYKEGVDNESEELFEKQFDMCYLQDYSTVSIKPLMDLTYLDNLFSWIPYYKKGKLTKVYDTTESFWNYNNYGCCDIKLYVNGTYNLGIINNKVRRLNEWDFEFYKPQLDYRVFDTKLTDIQIYNETDMTYNVYMNILDLDKMWLLKNFVLAIIYIIIWLALVIIVSRVNIQAGIGIGVGTIPILLKLLGLI